MLTDLRAKTGQEAEVSISLVFQIHYDGFLEPTQCSILRVEVLRWSHEDKMRRTPEEAPVPQRGDTAGLGFDRGAAQSSQEPYTATGGGGEDP